MRNEELLVAEEGGENVVAYKSFALAVRIVKLGRHLREAKQEYVISKQLPRSGTSIGANVEEAIGGVSRPDFAAKLGIAYKEARETNYWLRRLAAADYLTPEAHASIARDCDEVCRLLRAILNTLRATKEKKQAKD